ncbi:hypothetical protein [Ferrimonas balearica]|uniref:hypothetical protein n=1 Tax=Ferrimonas balearica TaxID=44012 RepID=UPI001C9988EF|nr:hypothetical protein [Ferrimonas balearica]MBY5991599.1 hypothetical protein [Ferrimonas balearica]
MGLRFNLLAEQAANRGYGIKLNANHPEHYDLYALVPHRVDHSMIDMDYQELLEELDMVNRDE